MQEVILFYKGTVTDTSDGLAAIQAQLNNLGREIKKVNERVYVAQVGYESCGGRYRVAALGFYQRDNENASYQERRETMEKSLSKFIAESMKRQDENSNLIKEIRASTDAAIRNKVASIKALEIQIGKMSKVLQEKGSGILPCSTKMNPIDHVKSISTTVKANTPSMHRINPIRYVVSSPQNKMQFFKPSQSIIPFPSRLIDDGNEEKMVLVILMDREKSGTSLKKLLMEKLRMRYQIEASTNMHEKEKDPGSFTISCYINNICFEKALADLGSSVSVMPYSTFINLDLSELTPTKLIIELADRTIKCPKDMPEDIKVPLILRRPFFSNAHAKIDVFKRKITLRVGDDKIVFRSDNPTNNIIKRVFALGLRERMELDLEARLIGEALILNRSLDYVYGD
ncbi:mitochondrial proton/calcium exchanger protein-like protein isoform X1, partial [Tanacetum coccineum]